MIARKRVTGFAVGSTVAELHRDVFTVLAHQLGGIASALALRTDALAAVLPRADHAALGELAGEVRDVSRMLRLMRGPLGNDALAPAPSMPVATWWQFVSRLTTQVLPHGVVLRAHLDAAPLLSLQASTLAHLWLAACKGLAAEGLQSPCAITLSVTPHGDAGGAGGTQLLAQVAAAHWPTPRASRARSPWLAYSTKLARLNGAELRWWTVEHDAARWMCSMGAR